jgi:hypothetical protein
VNVGTGIENRYPEKFVYTNVELLDLPEQDITPGIDETFHRRHRSHGVFL